MAVKYHISPDTGRPNICRAGKKDCPVGGDHYGSKEEARKGYERDMSKATVAAPVSKKAKAAPTKDTGKADPAELRESVGDYRNPATSEEERQHIRDYWERQGVKNQFHAMLKAAEIEKTGEAPADEELFDDFEAMGGWDAPDEAEPTLDFPQTEVPALDDDFSDIKCDDCGKPLDRCRCDSGECEYCGAYEGDEHYEECPLYRPKPKAYSWE